MRSNRPLKLRLRACSGHPSTARISRAAGEMDAATLEFDEEQDVETAKARVSTVKKSQASIVAACWRRNCRQLGPARLDQQPRHSREGEIGERKEHEPMFPSPATERSGSRNVGLLAEPTSCEARRDLVVARAREPLNQRNPSKAAQPPARPTEPAF